MKPKILLIDDDAGVRDLYGKLLRDENYDVFIVPNARFASETLFFTNLDIVLLDINLPDFGGEMLFEVIRSQNPDLKIIISSVYPVTHQKKWIHGAHGYFDKAQGTKALLEMISEILGRYVSGSVSA